MLKFYCDQILRLFYNIQDERCHNMNLAEFVEVLKYFFAFWQTRQLCNKKDFLDKLDSLPYIRVTETQTLPTSVSH